MWLLFYLFVIIGTINLIHIAAFLMGGNIYDAVIARKLRAIARLRGKQKPLISIVIPAYNEELSIKRCLDSVRRNSYKKIQVIVNNDASLDKTAEIVKMYIGRYSKFPLRLISRRANHGKASGLNYAIKKYAAGDLVMTLDGDSLLHKHALRNVVKYFHDPKVAGVAANVRIIEEFTPLGLLQRFEHMISYRSKKLYTLLNCELIIGGVASTYRRRILRAVHYYDTDTVTEDIGLSMKVASRGNKQNRLVYAPDVVAMTEGVHSFSGLLNQRFRWKLGNLQNLIKYRGLLFSKSREFSKTLTWYRVPIAYIGELMLLLEPVVLVYIFYLSIRFMTPGLILSAYSIITIYLLLIIFPDEHLSLRQKVKTSLISPAMYFVFYIMNVVQLVSIARCLSSAPKIMRLKSGPITWVSPQRAGRAVTNF